MSQKQYCIYFFVECQITPYPKKSKQTHFFRIQHACHFYSPLYCQFFKLAYEGYRANLKNRNPSSDFQLNFANKCYRILSLPNFF